MAKVAVIGSGGREHTLVWKLAQSPKVDKIFAIPGSAGMASLAECVNLPVKAPFTEIIDFLKSNDVSLVAVGPEQPLVDGMADTLLKEKIPVFGPTKDGALMEGSKKFAKEIMDCAGVPTGTYQEFSDAEKALAALETSKFPIVVKADGLAAGKGVTVAPDKETAAAAIKEAMVDGVFGASGGVILLEEYLEGEEATVLAIVDGKNILPLDSSQDHKPALDGDKGPNTGGMGAYSPAPVVTPEVMNQINETILKPTLAELQKRGIDYKGVLYAGLMITAEGPKVIEFNCRFGDPETQVVLPRLDSDLYEVMMAAVKGKLSETNLKWKDETAVCVIGASGGYPGSYKKGITITGIEKVESLDNAVFFHAGTKKENGEWITSGGRVFGITGFGKGVQEARDKAYEGIAFVNFEGMHFRKDIAHRALARLK